MYVARSGLAALWWGSLTSLCFWVVPLMFFHLPNPATAGALAAKLFSAQTWVTLGCGTGLIVLEALRLRKALPGKLGSVRFWVIAGMSLALLVEFAIAPRILARDNLRVWHSLGSTTYVLQWVCATITLHTTLSLRTSDQV